MNNIIKVDFYDEFNCTADSCSFTCCEGWEIIVDTNTYNKWKSNVDQSKYTNNHVKTKEDSKGTKNYIKMESHQCCPFLDEIGLCNIVIKYGDEVLPNTCKVFPRQEHSFGNVKEYSLTCACPAVVDIINNKKGEIKFWYDVEDDFWDNTPLEYSIREAMISLMQNAKFQLKDRLLLTYHILLFIKKESVSTKEILSKYQNEKYLLSLVNLWRETRIDKEESCKEINELFLDIVENYRRERNFSYYLKDISELAEDMDPKNAPIEWNDFKAVYGQYEKLIENCVVSKIIGNCINDGIDEMIMSFQMVITEYVMVKYSSFLRWLINEKKIIDYNDMRDYIVFYSRIIGYNTEGIIEFWEDGFDDAVWGFDYMLLLINI